MSDRESIEFDVLLERMGETLPKKVTSFFPTKLAVGSFSGAYELQDVVLLGGDARKRCAGK